MGPSVWVSLLGTSTFLLMLLPGEPPYPHLGPARLRPARLTHQHQLSAE